MEPVLLHCHFRHGTSLLMHFPASTLPLPPVQALQAQLAQRGEELLKFETVHKLIRGQLESRALEAEQRAERASVQAREVQRRRATEMEGWASDVGQLRKRIAAVDRRLKQMSLEQRLPDDERRDAALAKHARQARGRQGAPCIWLVVGTANTGFKRSGTCCLHTSL